MTKIHTIDNKNLFYLKEIVSFRNKGVVQISIDVFTEMGNLLIGFFDKFPKEYFEFLQFNSVFRYLNILDIEGGHLF